MNFFACRGSVPEIERYVAEGIGCGPIQSDACIGIIDNNQPICGITLAAPVSSRSALGYTFDAQLSIAASNPRWCTREMLRKCFHFFFNDLGLTRVTSLVQCRNTRSNRFVMGLGFEREGTLREAIEGQDAHIYSMLKHECRWLENANG